MNGLDIARQRIAEEAQARTGMLDLGKLGLIRLPDELFELIHLRGLNLGSRFIFENGKINVVAAHIAPNLIHQELTRLVELPALKELFLCNMPIPDLATVHSLQQLCLLDCSETSVSDLVPLQELTALERFNCSGTSVGDLTPLQELTALERLECSRTLVSNLTPLQELTALEFFDCSNTSVSDLTPLQGSTALQELRCSGTSLSDLAPLKELTALQELRCSGTSVSDLGPLQELTALQELRCSGNSLSDLAPLRELTALERLECSRTSVSELTPLQEMMVLERLNCSGTLVSDLTPLQELTALERLDCSGTSVSVLTPLQELKALERLDCSGTTVSDLTPLQGLTALKHLDCSSTSVSDLTPLQGLTALKRLECSGTPVSDLTPLQGLTALEELHVDAMHIKLFDPDFWNKAKLKTLVAYKTELQGFPNEVLSQESNENCHSAIRAHVTDLGNAPIPLNQVKLMVLGNGRIGKTQICNRLRDLPYEDKADSTHGITITEAPIPGGNGTFAIWDFGGQDIYHGTHALFLKSRAVFLLVWTSDADDAAEHEQHGMHFRNQPLSWWLDYIRRFGSEQSTLVVVQNKLDTDYDRGDHPAVVPLRNKLAFCRSLAYSAANDEGREVLDAYLKSAAMRFNPPLIGKGRLRVMERLIEMRESDATLPAEKRRNRTLSLPDFESICDKAGSVSDNEQLLRFLHNAGIVFWREGLFENRIVLDQAWVLDAIYTVFNREKCLQSLRLRAGRFTRQELGWMVWDGERYSTAEQDLFISFMRTCGICFEISKGRSNAESTYIAPDLLPGNWSQEERSERWGEEPAEHERSFSYESLPPALLRNLICRIGERAGIRCDYWRNGFYGFEVETASRVLLEQTIQDDWRGEIRVQTRGGRAHELLDRVINALGKEEQRLGLTGTELSKAGIENVTDAKTMSFGNASNGGRSFYVSYAWADRDDAPEHSRERIVDEFCAAAAKRNIKIHRDRDDMSIGNRISDFMTRLERADRVIVVLSDKYLRSSFCMHELHGIWRHSRSEGERFLKRVRVYTEEDALVWSVEGRADYAVHWKVAHEKINSIVKSHGINVLGDQDKVRFGLMEKFAIEIGDILGELTDALQSRNLDELVDYSFDDEDEDFDDA